MARVEMYEANSALRIPVEVITENGYCIVRSSDLEEINLSAPGDYHFIVYEPSDVEHLVVVEFTAEAVKIVEQRMRRRLSPESLFWVECAERSLATYLWEKDCCPPADRLTLKSICIDDLEVARRWDGN